VAWVFSSWAAPSTLFAAAVLIDSWDGDVESSTWDVVARASAVLDMINRLDLGATIKLGRWNG